MEFVLTQKTLEIVMPIYNINIVSYMVKNLSSIYLNLNSFQKTFVTDTNTIIANLVDVKSNLKITFSLLFE